MVRKVCLDSDVLIDLLRGSHEIKKEAEMMSADFYTTSINFFEIWFGRKDSETIIELLSELKPLNFDTSSARISGDMLRTLKSRGQMVEMRDLFVAATCIKNGVELWTRNKKHFERLREFGLILK